MKTLSKLLVLTMIVSQTLPLLGEDKPTLPLPSSGNVTLTLAEYDHLVDLAAKAAKKHEAPPVAYTIKHADLKLRVTNDTVLGTIVEEGEVFTKGAAKVPLTSGLTILNARQEGKTLPLLQEGSIATAVLPGPAEFAVSLDTGLPLGIEAGRASFSLPVPAAGSVRLSLVIPGDHSNVRINPGLITSRSSENGQTKIEATLAPGQPANVWWTTREIAAPTVPKEVRFLSDVKTLVSVGESDLRIAALADVTVVQGEPTEFSIGIPEGYEVTGATGATVETAETQNGVLVLKLGSGTPRSHQFLISMEKPIGDSKIEVPFLSVKDAQRETGEVLVEGVGAMEMTVTEGGSLKRMDVKEINPYLRSLARNPLQAAFRFHRQPSESPSLALQWTRFPNSAVLAAIAERAVVTTLVTSEGRSLTEVTLTVKNQAQAFMKVTLPPGATILSADVAGEKVKPGQAPDGTHVPLLRANFRPTGPYTVSFVFMHSGTPFAKKGGSEISLPSMDIPISVMQWEVFLPEQYKVKDFGGDAIAAKLLGSGYRGWLEDGSVGLSGGVSGLAGKALDVGTGSAVDLRIIRRELLVGQLGGVVLDPNGAVISGAQVKVTSVEKGMVRTATTDSNGKWVVSSMPSGTVKVEVSKQGFRSTVYDKTPYDASRPQPYSTQLDVGAVAETVTVTAPGPTIDGVAHSARDEKKEKEPAQQQASANVFNLQKKVAGVLPVRVDVPRAGASYLFARALVLDEETKLTFSYKTK
jgi:hypothetical protein